MQLEDHLVFYRSYHYDTLNVLVHSVFVPTILFTSAGLLMNVPLWSSNTDIYNLGNALAVGYGFFYLSLDVQGGLISAPLLYAMCALNTKWSHESNNYNTWLIGMFIFSWIMQFLSHAFFEKRAPALLDNLTQALVLAPFFVLFELLFLLGWRRDVKKRVDVRAAANIAAFKKLTK